ncbi:Eco57I restriction-modification methylase domain-containing protein [Deinococcus sp. ME38]|uniref:Eco57I restriction-modification methylase domain-containing protein n=1 Tax=Deinococcus sp. ME38 TaxID=3400344 RepID=UPI003B5CB532
MTTISATQLANVRVHGLGLTDDFLLKLSDRAQTAKVDSATPASYDLPPKTSLEEAILDAWDDARKAWARYDLHHTDPWLGWVRPLLKALDYSFGSGGATGGKYAVRFLTETGDVPLHYAPPVMEGDHLKPADLDRVTQHGEPGHGTLRASPHGLMQGYLNATPGHWWGLVTNGEVLRLLRDNAQVTRPAYAEFNIGEMMRTEDARAFRVLYLLLHRSRLKGAKDSILEGWNTTATTEGVKARDSLRDGVQRAIEHLGTGFLEKNPDLYDTLRDSTQAKTDLYRACLNMVYQLVFLFVTEDRDLLFARDEDGQYIPDAATRERAAHYLTRAMRARAATLTGTNTHTDAYAGWERLLAHVRVGFAPLGLPALGSHLFQPNALTGLKLGNQAFYAALRALSEITVDNQRRPVNYAGLDSEELGSIYESLLELVPRVQPGPRFELQTLAGNERKTTGSYYTPSGLINLLLDSALEPVIEDATRDKQPADAIAALKKLKIIDPACGSGHFLIAAARRVGARLAELEEETSQPSPAAQRRATRTVIAHCIYGADINPMAIELAKVALWLESQDAGKPLAFLDHRLRVGNSLLGTTPELMNAEDEIPEKTVRGVTSRAVKAHTLHLPDAAFSAIEGDDRKTVTELKKRNKQEREHLIRAAHGAQTLFNANDDLAPVSAIYQALDKIEPERLENVQAQASTFAAIRDNQTLKRQKLLADAWCAAFVAPKVPDITGITTATLNALKHNPDAHVTADVRVMAQAMAEQYKFLHPHIEFPDVFTPEQGGFDCVLGNPPWELSELKEKEWFATRMPTISEAATGAIRKNLIAELSTTNQVLYSEFLLARRESEALTHYVFTSSRFPLTARGRINTYAIFSEMGRKSINSKGMIGMIVPSGLATDDTTKFFLQDVIERGNLFSFISFENERFIFPGVHHAFKFALYSIGGSEKASNRIKFVFFARSVDEVNDPNRFFLMNSKEISLLNPNTKTAPIFRTARDFKITREIYVRLPILINEQSSENLWSITFKPGLFNMTAHSHLFSREPLADYSPLYEAKLFNQFDHRYSSYIGSESIIISQDDKANPSYFITPQFYIPNAEIERRLSDGKNSKGVKQSWNRQWLLGFRDVTNATNERSGIFSLIPRYGPNHKSPILLSWLEGAETLPALIQNFNAFVFDYCIRQKISGVSLGFFILKQLPVLPPSTFTPPRLAFITPRVLELTYTAYDLTGFARDLNYPGDPFTWNDERRFWIRAELDALYFILYGIDRDDVDYIMDTFPIVRKKDVAAHGTYRTKDAILAIYDELHTLGLERLGEYQSRVLTLGLEGGDVAGGWRPE